MTVLLDSPRLRVTKRSEGFEVRPGPGTQPGREVLVPFDRLVSVSREGEYLAFLGAFYRDGLGQRILVGPLDPEVLTAAVPTLRDRMEQPWSGTEVEFEELTGDPSRFVDRVVHVWGPFHVTSEAVRLGPFVVRCPDGIATQTQGTSYRQVSAFCCADGDSLILESFRQRPAVDVPHHQVSPGITRVLLAEGAHVAKVDVAAETPDPLYLPVVGTGRFAGVKFEHPLAQWFEEFRSITVFRWAHRLMSDDEIRRYARWECTSLEELDAAPETDWGFLDLGSIFVHPGVLRSSANPIGALLQLEVDEVAAKCEASEAAWSGEGSSPGESIRRSLPAPGSSPEFANASDQAGFVWRALTQEHCDPRHMTVRTVPVVPRSLRSAEGSYLYEQLFRRVERLARIRELGAPEIVVRNEIREVQRAFGDVYHEVVRELFWRTGKDSVG